MTLQSTDLLPANFNYNEYIETNHITSLLNDSSASGDLSLKRTLSPTFSVDPQNQTPFPPQYDDLARLHYLIRSRKVFTALEFGVGKSTLVIGEAIRLNRSECSPSILQNLRRENPFQLHSVDNYQKYIDIVKNQLPPVLNDSKICHFYHSDLFVGTFMDRICTFYETLPNICPDLIYLDAPDQFSPIGNIRGITTAHQDRMAMSADILAIEHFLQPSTLIVIDGRTANARFLKSNLQRKWSYFYDQEWDQHFFELQEEPLGIYNKRMIDFCLGDTYYSRLYS